MSVIKNAFFLILGLVIIFGSIFLFVEKRLDLGNNAKIVKINDTSIKVEIADTVESRAQGLSGKKTLQDGTGMLFIFDEPGQYGFWMKDMNFAIDIVWISESFEVIGIEHEVTPETFPTIFYPPGPVRYVLELPAGFSRNRGIDIEQFISYLQ